MRNLRKALITVFAAGAILAASGVAQASATTAAPAATVQHAAPARHCLSVPVFYKANGNHDFHWPTKETCGRPVRTQLLRSSYRGWLGYSPVKYWFPLTIYHKWKSGCRYGAGTYNYMVKAQDESQVSVVKCFGPTDRRGFWPRLGNPLV
jgi:hypothetical protein